MKVVIEPERKDRKQLLQRPYIDNAAVFSSVQQILNEVKQKGDDAIRSLTKKFDGIALQNFVADESEIVSAANELTTELKNAIQQAAKNIEAFHKSQLSEPAFIETMPGVVCWRKNVAIEKVGLYIPGGTAPLFSTVLMLGIPAKLAGCREVSLFTPCDRQGKIHPAILYSASLVGISKIYKIGGAQAIAAMTYGTESIDPVYKIFGPGNQYVTGAKQLAQMHGVAIDMPAGPSEVCVMADGSANPAFIAADLLSQAEHGVDSQVLLVCNDVELAHCVNEEVEKQLNELQRKEIASKALKNSKAIVLADQNDAIELVNEYAPEHLIINCKDAEAISEKIINAGSVFIGCFSPESVGDYASGTNHTLPTNGFAKAYSGVSVDSFVKKITFQKLSAEGLNVIGQTVIEMAKAEGLLAHANAVAVRIGNGQ
jgi:histidinol dehydrogenase